MKLLLLAFPVSVLGLLAGCLLGWAKFRRQLVADDQWQPAGQRRHSSRWAQVGQTALAQRDSDAASPSPSRLHLHLVSISTHLIQPTPACPSARQVRRPLSSFAWRWCACCNVPPLDSGFF